MSTFYSYIQEKEWSPSLTAAFAFAESLTHGACGHQPIELDLASWNTLIKVCCYRGAIFRALEILNDTMPQNGITPDVFTYNTILAALARVVRTMSYYIILYYSVIQCSSHQCSVVQYIEVQQAEEKYIQRFFLYFIYFRFKKSKVYFMLDTY